MQTPEHGIVVSDAIREQLKSAVTSSTGDRNAALSRTVQSFDMQKASKKYTIFETIAGPNAKRFIPFNDMPDANSKYKREQVGIVEFTTLEGREKVPRLNPEPHEMMPDY